MLFSIGQRLLHLGTREHATVIDMYPYKEKNWRDFDIRCCIRFDLVEIIAKIQQGSVYYDFVPVDEELQIVY